MSSAGFGKCRAPPSARDAKFWDLSRGAARAVIEIDFRPAGSSGIFRHYALLRQFELSQLDLKDRCSEFRAAASPRWDCNAFKRSVRLSRRPLNR